MWALEPRAGSDAAHSSGPVRGPRLSLSGSTYDVSPEPGCEGWTWHARSRAMYWVGSGMLRPTLNAGLIGHTAEEGGTPHRSGNLVGGARGL